MIREYIRQIVLWATRESILSMLKSRICDVEASWDANFRILESHISKLEGRLPVGIPTEAYDIARHAKLLIEQAEPLGASGEYKRHLVYSQLIDAYPNTRKRVLALAIELAICSI